MTTPSLQALGLRKTYGDSLVLDGVDFDLQPGEVKVILGASGSGKSTLLRLLALLENADEGSIYLEGARVGRTQSDESLPERSLAAQRSSIGMVFQRFNLFPHLSALGNVTIGLTTVRRMAKAEAIAAAEDMLVRVGLGNRMKQFPSELSGGQQQRVAIARALVMNPRVMLFDEPTSALDPELVGEVLEVMEDLARDQMTMAVVTHEISFARSVASRVAFMCNGQIIEESDADSFFSSPSQPETRRFLQSVLDRSIHLNTALLSRGEVEESRLA
ncbi:MAG: amino acid ABC transporter ATP-binding protein [Candidatus Nanopelagicales bacterium]